ncbi:MAG: hypothetical protein ACLSAP_12285 [Oscillospiraceae bacterium]
MSTIQEMSADLRQPALRILQAAQKDKTTQRYIAIASDDQNAHAVCPRLCVSAVPWMFERQSFKPFHALTFETVMITDVGLFIDTDDAITCLWRPGSEGSPSFGGFRFCGTCEIIGISLC